MARRLVGAATLPASVAVGTGVGTAVGGAIAPKVQELANATWARFPNLPLDALVAAQLVASGERSLAWGAEEALATGINPERFAALVDVIDTAPDLGTLFVLLRRGLITEARFREGAKKGDMEDEWADALVALREVLLSPAELANARQQGFVSDAEQIAQAARQGVTADRAEIQYQLAGLPPGAMDGLTMLRRGIIDEATYRQLVREGHTKTKYTDALLGLRTHILTATDAANL